MNEKKTTPLTEVTAPEYVDRARARADRRKSPWNLILLPLAAVSAGLITFLLFRLMWIINVAVYPHHEGSLHAFWQEGLSTRAFISSFLLAMPLFFAAIPLALLLTNSIAWCIPSARRTFQKESRGHKGTSYKQSMQGLLWITKYVVPICLILSLIGALTLKELR